MYGDVATINNATQLQTYKNLDMSTKDSKTDKPCTIHSVMVCAFFFNRLFLKASKNRKYVSKVKGAGKKYYLGEVFKNINDKYFTYLGNDTFIVHKP